MVEAGDGVHFRVFDNVYLAVTDGEPANPEFNYFRLDDRVVYVPFHNDFGPFSLGMVYQFCQILLEELEKLELPNIALVTTSDRKAISNSIFLLGSFMIMHRNCNPGNLRIAFEDLKPFLKPFRDVSHGPQEFDLHVEDCWDGVGKAKSLNWVSFHDDGFDIEEYLNFDSPLNADLHEIVPGKIIAMRGPRDLGPNVFWHDIMRDGEFSHRDFSPLHYADILHQFEVKIVVRLNDHHYDKQTFIDAGIAVADLFFEDCSDPPVDVVAKFLALADAAPGAIAVHCKAGLGRTGTLIGLFLMRRHGFTAREALGWLRVVRPGSVIGGQQDFLCAREATMRRRCALLAGAPAALAPAALAEDADVAEVQALVDDTCRHFDAAYAAARAAHGLGPHDSPPGSPGPRPRGAESPLLSAPPPPPAAVSAAGELAAHVSLAAERRAGARAGSLRPDC